MNMILERVINNMGIVEEDIKCKHHLLAINTLQHIWFNKQPKVIMKKTTLKPKDTR